MRRRLAVAIGVFALVVAQPIAAASPALELSAHVVVTERPAEFRGLSAVTVSSGGTRAQVLSDRGRLFDVALWRDDEGRLTRVVVLQAKYLYMYEPHRRIDSEGHARAPNGGAFVSSEKPPGILHYLPRRSWPDRTWPVPDLNTKRANRGIEALAIDPQGRLVAIPETRPEGEPGFPVFRLDGDRWVRIAVLEGRDAFSVVGADFGPDGRLYVLERAVSALGFRSRIRRLSLTEDGAATETLLQTRLGAFDNLEGISVWRDGDGALRLLLVSDDNFLSVQRTEFVEFLVAE